VARQSNAAISRARTTRADPGPANALGILTSTAVTILLGECRSDQPGRAVPRGTQPPASVSFLHWSGGRAHPTLAALAARRCHEPSGNVVARLLALRIRREYEEMPGMHLTLQQACRLWGLGPDLCTALLNALVREGFSCRPAAGPSSAPSLGSLGGAWGSDLDSMHAEPARGRLPGVSRRSLDVPPDCRGMTVQEGPDLPSV